VLAPGVVPFGATTGAGSAGGAVAIAAFGVPTSVTAPSGADDEPRRVLHRHHAQRSRLLGERGRRVHGHDLTAQLLALLAQRASGDPGVLESVGVAAAAVESQSVTISPTASSPMTSSTNLARPAVGAVRGARPPTSLRSRSSRRA
jgi:hypothetical protein